MRVQSHIRKYRASAFCQKSIKLSTFASISPAQPLKGLLPRRRSRAHEVRVVWRGR